MMRMAYTAAPAASREPRDKFSMESPVSLFSEASRYIPGGVNSPVRAFRGVGGTPVFIERARRRARVGTPTASATSTTSARGAR